MKYLVALMLVLFLFACETEEYFLCPDNVTRVLNIDNCPQEKPSCPACDDMDPCTRDVCGSSTNYECRHENIIPCDGNDLCELGEYPLSDDCPSCNDQNDCTKDGYDYEISRCTFDEIQPCCGNDHCERGETFVDCPKDCKQKLDIKIDNFRKTTSIPSVDTDLTRTDYVYLIVDFKINNIGIDEEETIEYQKKNGFYYDPFKMRLQDDEGNFYDVEYDSDILDRWLDYTIISKGNTVGASLLFIIPRSVNGVRLIAYDKYGSRLDVAEIY